MAKKIDIVGQKFGRLTAIKSVGKDIDNNYLWECVCDCGNKKTTITTRLLNGTCKSCGCLRKELSIKRATKHGMCSTRLNQIYRKMKQRCFSEYDKRYANYGGRGITICDEWLGKNGFIAFFNWAIESGYSDELTIDRIDVNGNYEPSNCRWATPKMQANNTTRNHYITYNGETHTIKEWSEIKNISYGALLQRINKLNWTLERALNEKKREICINGR